MKHARSSHSIVCHKKIIYIVGGISDKDDIVKHCEKFDSRTKESQTIASCKFVTYNSCLASISRDNLVKIGGIFYNGEKNFHV